jgi:uncharacterized protein
MTATARLISGNRLHLQHGPIDLIIGADGAREQVELAYRAAVAAFPSILPALVTQLPMLRTPLSETAQREATSSVAHRMVEAVWPFRDRFITPMAAVAGSVADEMLDIMGRAATLDRAYVNNGGDIAIHLANSAIFTIGVVGDLTAPGIDARITTRAGDGIGGIATSGWRGRSQSLGVADAVTVLARTAAEADAAATMIANAVHVDDPAIRRLPAHDVKDDSDLRDLLVTVGVGQLSDEQRAKAISFGADRARQILSKNLIVAAYIQLQGKMVVVGGNALIARAA